jgi:hypothetical protein
VTGRRSSGNLAPGIRASRHRGSSSWSGGPWRVRRRPRALLLGGLGIALFPALHCRRSTDLIHGVPHRDGPTPNEPYPSGCAASAPPGPPARRASPKSCAHWTRPWHGAGPPSPAQPSSTKPSPPHERAPGNAGPPPATASATGPFPSAVSMGPSAVPLLGRSVGDAGLS